LRFVRTPTARLGRHDVGRKGLYLGAVDLAASNLGIAFASSRWLLGRIEGVPPEFVPSDSSFTRIPLAVFPCLNHRMGFTLLASPLTGQAAWRGA
jgi:hypothetical protein